MVRSTAILQILLLVACQPLSQGHCHATARHGTVAERMHWHFGKPAVQAHAVSGHGDHSHDGHQHTHPPERLSCSRGTHLCDQPGHDHDAVYLALAGYSLPGRSDPMASDSRMTLSAAFALFGSLFAAGAMAENDLPCVGLAALNCSRAPSCPLFLQTHSLRC